MIMLLSLIVCGMAVCLHGYRMFWTLRSLPQIHTGAFDGELMRAGASFMARRQSRNGARRTIICFPGFQEDMRYFQALYTQEASELILLNNANYHCPLMPRRQHSSIGRIILLELERLNMTAFISISPLTDWPAGRRYSCMAIRAALRLFWRRAGKSHVVIGLSGA